MMLDAPLAPPWKPTPTIAPAIRAQTRLADHRRRRASGAALELSDLKPYLPAHWWEHLQTYGTRRTHGMSFEPYPKSAPRACRRDAWPEDGGAARLDLDLIRAQYLDAYGIEFGILGPLGVTGQGEVNLDFCAALASAVNDWQRDTFARPEPRLQGSAIVVPYEDGAASAAEIERCAADPAFAQVFMLTRTSEPLGNRRYWPIYEAAERHELPVGLHVFGASGHPYTGAGWPSYYIEEGAGHSTSCQTAVTSLVIEGVFERFPNLKVVMVEGGFAWLPALAWRLDKLFERMRGEVPHLKRKPSEYIREHIWVTTQPMEEPEDRRHAARHDGMDRLGPAAVRLRLSALGFRRSVPRLPGRPAAERTADLTATPGRVRLH